MQRPTAACAVVTVCSCWKRMRTASPSGSTYAWKMLLGFRRRRPTKNGESAETRQSDNNDRQRCETYSTSETARSRTASSSSAC